MLKRQSVKRDMLSLREQATATMNAACSADNAQASLHLRNGATTLDKLADAKLREFNAEPILDLADNASAQERRQARQRRAVRQRDDVYLPACRPGEVSLPNIFLRSALFAAATPGTDLCDAHLATMGDAAVVMTGPRLGTVDRRVFAALLSHYNEEDRPLSKATNPSWIEISLWRLAQLTSGTHGANVYTSILNSLIRLSSAQTRIRVNRRDVPISKLIEIAIDEHHATSDNDRGPLHRHARIRFRIGEAIATLFGPYTWTSVHLEDLSKHAGLRAWLAGFFSSHAKPYPSRVTDLHKYSGSSCDLREFRRRLKRSLTQLQSTAIPQVDRVATFELADDKITVTMESWRITRA
ncbi:hypothetical protein CR155_20260 [Pollutimonas nitritireducens]|uniref:Uncharacterized protein n=1 Tax=Pollutimonas nitritireducens TaxID=2045209 RepID=A0A2N4UAK4_9BURK|nr:hypothetical protein [Pollutimonas nitritireducens]PLC52033.1 hypothetical protein CR155_20260 [Pollutimonas nitritireducens]